MEPTDSEDVPSQATQRRRLFLGSSGLAPWVVALCISVVVLGPVIAILLGSFSSDVPGAPNVHFTLDNFAAVFTGYGGEDTLRYTINSLKLAVACVIVSTVLGGSIAWLVVRTDLPGRHFFHRAFMLPMFYSVILGIIGWIMLAEQSAGYVNVLWRYLTGSSGHVVSIYSFPGMVWVMGLFYMPLALTISANSLERGDVSLDEAAAVAGASSWQRFRSITLPMASPGFLAAALFVFALSLEHFATPAFLGTQIHFGTLAYDIFLLNRGYPTSPAQGAVVALLLIALTTMGLLVYRRMTRREERYVSVSGKGQRPQLIQLGRWRWVVFSVLLVVFFVTIVAPIGAVVLRAFMQVRTSSFLSADFGFGNFLALTTSGNFVQSLRNSLILSVASAVICTALGIFLGHWIIRRKSRATAVADYIVSLPLGIPGIVFGVGMLWAFVGTPLYLTLWILMLAYVIRYAVYGVRNLSAGMSQLDPALEEAAMVSGATRIGSTRWITAPLLKGAMASSWLLVFLLVFQELSATIILYGPTSSTLSIDIFNELDSGFYGQASALAMVQLGIVVLLVVIFLRVFRVRLSSGISA